MNGLGPSLIILAAGLMVLFSLLERRKVRSNYRIIPAFDQLQKAAALTTEAGEGIQVSVGHGSILSPQAGSSLAAIDLLHSLTIQCLHSDAAPFATSGDGTVHLLAFDTIREINRNRRVLPRTTSLLSGPSPFSYIAGAMLMQRYEENTLLLTVGSHGPEVGLLAESAERMSAQTTGGSDSLLATAVLMATNRSTLLGEEMFAASAYLAPDPVKNTALKTQDMLRVALIAAILVGAVVKLVGK